MRKTRKSARPFAGFFVYIIERKKRTVEDNAIVELLWARDEAALREIQNKYGGYLYTIANNILGNGEDSGECVNDTYFKAWCSIPPTRPAKLGAYLAAVVRNLAITVFRKRSAQSHGGSQYALSLDELGECVSGGELPEQQAEAGYLSRCINAYLRTLSTEARDIFVCRYFFSDSISDIASYFGAGESKIKSSLFRSRAGLREYLKKEGFNV